MRRDQLRALWVLPAALAVAFARPRLSSALTKVKETSDVYALPPTEALPALSLGYRATLADLLFTSTIISYGMFGEQRRRFEHVGDYLDAIIALDPLFREPYRLADTFIIYQPTGEPTDEDVHHARRILDQGLAMRPYDGQLWLSAGQFMAFIATQFLANEDEKKEYRAAGARALARAGELVSGNDSVQWQALAAAGIFTREGERKAAIAFLEKVYAVTDNDELRAAAGQRLKALEEEAALDLARRRNEAFNTAWRADLPFASRTRMLVVGPAWDGARCAGRSPDVGNDVGCSQTWAAWIKGALGRESGESQE